MTSRWFALAVLTAARGSLGFQFQSIASFAPSLRQDFGMSYADVGFLIGLYMSPGVLLAIPGGLLGQKFGDKRVVCFGLGLMAVGAGLMGVADTYAALVTGRLLSGIGGILLNVLMSKMIMDWFGEHEIVLAMAIFINSFPIGIGIALLALGPLAEVAGWRSAELTTAIAAVVCLALMVALYRPHANDRRPRDARAASVTLTRQELAMVSIAGAIWALYNGAYVVFIGFAPVFLTASGLSVESGGLLLGIYNWLGVFFTLAGGVIAQRWGHANLLMVVGMSIWAGGMLALLWTSPALPLLAMGIFFTLPVGVVLALPAEVLRPEARALGMGIFYTWLYIGQATLPLAAGRLQDIFHDTRTSLVFAVLLVLLLLVLFGLFRLLQTSKGRTWRLARR